jgi:hypothetical protein
MKLVPSSQNVIIKLVDHILNTDYDVNMKQLCRIVQHKENSNQIGGFPQRKINFNKQNFLVAH